MNIRTILLVSLSIRIMNHLQNLTYFLIIQWETFICKVHIGINWAEWKLCKKCRDKTIAGVYNTSCSALILWAGLYIETDDCQHKTVLRGMEGVKWFLPANGKSPTFLSKELTKEYKSQCDMWVHHIILETKIGYINWK